MALGGLVLELCPLALEHLHSKDTGLCILGVCPALSFLLPSWPGPGAVRDCTATLKAVARARLQPEPSQVRSFPTPVPAGARNRQLRDWPWWLLASGAPG